MITASSIDPYDWYTAPNNDGGHFEDRLFNPYGVESLEFIEKALFNSVLYRYAYEFVQTNGTSITADQVDKLVAIYGAHPNFANSGNVSANPDEHAAKYAARRTPSSGGLYLDIKSNFIKAKTYASAGSAYDNQKVEALNEVLKSWEQVYVSTVINYTYSAIDYLAVTNPTNSDLANGMHNYGEAIGFINGLYAVDESYRVITNAELESLLTWMHTPVNQNPTSYELVTDRVNALSDLQQILDEIQSVYSFTDAQMLEFKINWVNEEGR